MRTLAHLLAGGAAGTGLSMAVGLPLGWEAALVSGALGAAIPELEDSFFRLAQGLRRRKRKGRLLEVASYLGQERGPLHGLEVLVLLGSAIGLAGWLLPVPNLLLFYLSFLGGWLSHLLLDLVVGGIRPLSILMPYQWVFFPPQSRPHQTAWRILEWVVLVGCGVVWVWRLVRLLLH